MRRHVSALLMLNIFIWSDLSIPDSVSTSKKNYTIKSKRYVSQND